MNVSLLDGWLPWALQILTVLACVALIGRSRLRDRRFWIRIAPLCLGIGVVAGLLALLVTRAFLQITDPLPFWLWFWLGTCGTAVALGVTGWRGARWWRRTAIPFVAILALLTAGDALDISLGYYPTLGDMYGELTNQALPGQISLAQLGTIHGSTKTGRVVEVQIPSTYSNFQHRNEYVYLPPAWFRSTHRPKLPVVEMIGGEFAEPDNWIRAGNAVAVADEYAAKHHGFAPILVFADASGGFKVDTECVNGVNGPAQDHLVKDIPPFIEKTFGSSALPARWAVAGWSMGGTCAIVLVTAHPKVFGHFLDISGDQGPNMGDKQSTISKLYGGNAAAWAANDPLTAMAHHGKYKGVSGEFADGNSQGESLHVHQADKLSAAGAKLGITSKVIVKPGGHSWTFAKEIWASELAWLAKAVQTQGAH